MYDGRILFPSDYSHTGDLAFSLAASIAAHARAELLIVHVEEPSEAYAGEHYHGVANPTLDDLKRQLGKLIPRSSIVRCRRDVLVGKPAKAITDFARDNEVGLIVMGTHGCTGIAKSWLGA